MRSPRSQFELHCLHNAVYSWFFWRVWAVVFPFPRVSPRPTIEKHHVQRRHTYEAASSENTPVFGYGTLKIRTTRTSWFVKSDPMIASGKRELSENKVRRRTDDRTPRRCTARPVDRI
ncbi:hypothetical protein EDB89DRAFT_1961237 [Lactarius sanguifluus]|nr:hypothetical protein EDB89DRAFT_1961237 [Lactarius sanguifluus]